MQATIVKPIAFLNTDGRGHWSRTAKTVDITEFKMRWIGSTEHFGELAVYFDTRSWNVDTHGLIYTDRKWIDELRCWLRDVQGFSQKAVDDICYSEQGMQGDDYVSLDAGKLFIQEYQQKFAEQYNALRSKLYKV